MIQLTPHMRILLAIEAVDFRKGIDGLAAVCRQVLATDPMSGVLVVFCNRKRRALKLLLYDGQGFWIAQKRLSQGRFTWWPQKSSSAGQSESASLRLDPHQLQLLLWNGNPEHIRIAPMWRALQAEG
jgi:transposase